MMRHGYSGTRLHRIWKAMRTRCNNPNFHSYRYYGALGIRVCDEWNDFTAFRSWALANGYRDNLTIERKANALGYNPNNCTWVTLAEQSANRRFTKKRADGVLWWHVAKQHGISRPAYATRVHEGWPMEIAATWPMFKRRPGFEHRRDSAGKFA